MKRIFTPEQEAEIVSRYIAGETMHEIASDYGCDRVTVRNWLIKNGVQPRRKGPGLREWPEETAQEIRRMYEAGATLESLSQTFRAHTNRIRRLVEDTPRWKDRYLRNGGRIRSGAYIGALVRDDDPMASMRNSSGYVQEHRLVMARHLGRPLKPHETVHHLNGDKTDNRLENLQLRSGPHGKHQAFRCRACGSMDVEPVEV